MSAHLTLDELRTCARGDDAALIPAVARHYRECDECARLLRGMLALSEVANRSSRVRARSPAFTRVRLAVRMVLATILIASVLFLAQQWTAPPSLEERLAALATDEPIPEMYVHFQVGGAVETSTGGALRGRLLAAGLALADGRYEAAIAGLRELRNVAPESRVVMAYLGIALYLSGADSDETAIQLAIGSLAEDESVAVVAKWYLANHLLRAREPAAAREILVQLRSSGMYPQELSTELLARMDELAR